MLKTKEHLQNVAKCCCSSDPCLPGGLLLLSALDQCRCQSHLLGLIRKTPVDWLFSMIIDPETLLSSQILLWLIIVITWAWLARGTRTVFESIRSDSERRPVSSTSLEPVLIMTVEEWNDSGCAWVEHEEEHKEEEEDDRGQGRPTVNLSKTFSDSWFRHHPAPQWKFQLAPRTHCSLWKYQYQNDVKRYYPTPQSGLMCFWQLSQLSLTNGSIPLCTDQSKYSVKRMDSFKYI